MYFMGNTMKRIEIEGYTNVLQLIRTKLYSNKNVLGKLIDLRLNLLHYDIQFLTFGRFLL